MKHKIKVSLFPRNHDTDVICSNKKEQGDFDVYATISYQGNRIDKVDNQHGIKYTDDAKSALIESEGLVLCDNVLGFEKKAYLNRLQEAAELKKTVYISSVMYNWLGNDAFCDNNVIILNEVAEEKEYISNSLLEVECPVISILGSGENCGKLELLLSTKRSLQEKGYKVLAISGNPVAKLLGCEVLPAYLYSSELSSTWKIIKVNHYIHELAVKYKPDILVLSHAGGIMRLNKYENNNFGEISYILSNAIASDYGVFCTYYNKYYSDEYFHELKMLCGMFLGIELLRFYISRQACVVNPELEKIYYDFYDEEICKNSFSIGFTLGKEVLIPGDQNSIEKLTDEIIVLLSDNLEII